MEIKFVSSWTYSAVPHSVRLTNCGREKGSVFLLTQLESRHSFSGVVLGDSDASREFESCARVRRVLTPPGEQNLNEMRLEVEKTRQGGLPHLGRRV